MYLVENPKGAKGLTVKTKPLSTPIPQPPSTYPSKIFYANASIMHIDCGCGSSILHLVIFSFNNVSWKIFLFSPYTNFLKYALVSPCKYVS